jgi:hypothetical protein
MASAGVVLLQVLGGLALVYGVYWLSLLIMRQDRLVIDRRKGYQTKAVTKLIDGYVDATVAVDHVFDTTNTASRTYADLPRSFNRQGGAQFTYSLWLFVDDGSADNVAGKTLFLRGDPTAYTFQTTPLAATDAPGDAAATPPFTSAPDIAIKCPRVRFGPTYDSLVVEFNTVDDLDAQVTFDSATAGRRGDATARHNVLSLIQHKWVLLTWVFEDNVPIDDFENGIRVTFHVNDILYDVATVGSTLRQNAGNLCLLPGSDIKGCRIGNLTYYNYALGVDTVRTLYVAGPPTKYAASFQGGGSGDPLYLSLYNQMDIYNR